MSERKRVYFRKQLIVPAEHGSWSWLLVPYFVGVLVGGAWNLPVSLVLVGGLAGFLVRQPAATWMRARAGRGRRSDGPLAAAWSLLLAALAILCLAGLVAADRLALLWLLLPMAFLSLVYLVAARRRRVALRALWMELAGAAGLAAMAPAATIAASGALDGTAWSVWGLMAGQNLLGVLYVRLRIADTHGRDIQRQPILWSHSLLFGAVLVAAFLNLLPPLVTVPFAFFLLRAIWTVRRPRPIPNIKRFGFTEIGVEILGGLLIAAGWLL